MKKALILAVILFSAFLLWREYDLFGGRLPSVERLVSDFKNLDQILKQTGEVLTPPPLRGDVESNDAFLTKAGVILWTNQNRKDQNLTSLTESARLNAAAAFKVEDMFAKQYFAHEGPDGTSPGDWARKADYEFVVIGENLALGNFDDDQVLVQAWMDSPGHRANILNPNFSEIGVAVKKGIFEGHETWLSVQVFGKPLSACPSPDKDLKAKIDSIEFELNQIEEKLGILKGEIDSAQPKRGPEYNQKVGEYNDLVRQYNELLQELKTTISGYNESVRLFNECAGSS